MQVEPVELEHTGSARLAAIGLVARAALPAPEWAVGTHRDCFRRRHIRVFWNTGCISTQTSETVDKAHNTVVVGTWHFARNTACYSDGQFQKIVRKKYFSFLRTLLFKNSA